MIALLLEPAAAASRGRGQLMTWERKDDDSVRWTLASWMNQKSTFRAMDHWLAMNRTIDRFELGLGGGRQNYDLKIAGSEDEKEEIDTWKASAYWSIFGLDYEFEDSSEKFSRDTSLLKLRIFGTSSQVTNLTLSYGLRRTKFEDPSLEVKQATAGADLTIYLFSFLGIDGHYQKYFSAKDENDKSYVGDKIKYGVFIDLSILRLYGSQFVEKNKSKDATDVTSEQERQGIEFGALLFL